MAITTTCTGCGKTLAVADEYAGRQARCPACGVIYTVPTAAASTGSLDIGGATASSSQPANDLPLDLGPPITSSPQVASETANANVQYWMKADDGREYGPVDRAMLQRWFAEGRVGANYLLRTGLDGNWQPVAQFQLAAVTGSTNPFAAYPTGSMQQPSTAYPKPDQSGLVLALGILSWFVCPICGVIAWVIGGQALKDMQQGLVDPSNRGLVQVGYYLGMINVILAVCCFGFYTVVIAIAAISGNM